MRPASRLAVLASLAAGCTSPPTEEPSGRLDLRAAMGERDVQPVGVAVDPTGARYVFDETAGLYQVTATGATMILPMAAMPDPGVELRPPFTDLVAVGPERFAITALGDGFLLDVGLRTMQQHFCYVPDELPVEQDQRTDAVTYDPDTRLLHAQPRTFDAEGVLIASQVASYDAVSGVDVAWYDVPRELAAGGMAMVPGVGLVVGAGSELLAFADSGLTPLDDLARFGVASISGLAVDGTQLLVLDDRTDALVTIDLAALGL